MRKSEDSPWELWDTITRLPEREQREQGAESLFKRNPARGLFLPKPERQRPLFYWWWEGKETNGVAVWRKEGIQQEVRRKSKMHTACFIYTFKQLHLVAPHTECDRYVNRIIGLWGFHFPGSAISTILEVLGACPGIASQPGMMDETTSWEACIQVLVLAFLRPATWPLASCWTLMLERDIAKHQSLCSGSRPCEQKLFITAQIYLKRRRLRTWILLPVPTSLQVCLSDLEGPQCLGPKDNPLNQALELNFSEVQKSAGLPKERSRLSQGWAWALSNWGNKWFLKERGYGNHLFLIRHNQLQNEVTTRQRGNGRVPR